MPRAIINFPASIQPGIAPVASSSSLPAPSSATYTHAAALNAARKVLEPEGWEVLDGALRSNEEEKDADLYLTDYDLLPFEKLLPGASPSGNQSQFSSYVIRKALIRKHHLAHTLHLHSVKQQGSTAATPSTIKGKGKERTAQECAPQTWHFELQFADELDELLMDDLYDLKELLDENEARKGPEGGGEDIDISPPRIEHRWFILKPGMSDRGHGIRIFDSESMLRDIFEELEHAESDEEEADDDEEDSGKGGMLGQLRHFVIQEYISRPLLLDPPRPNGIDEASSSKGRKFHLRAYVLCVGGLQVYLFDEMLALFAPVPYASPSEASPSGEAATGSVDLRAHLTNTCLQSEDNPERDGRPTEENVHLWSDLDGVNVFPVDDHSIPSPSGQLSEAQISQVLQEVAKTVGQVFEACAKAGSVHWQMWPNAWEIFGVDMLVGWDADDEGDDDSLRTWLLEINAVSDRARFQWCALLTSLVHTSPYSNRTLSRLVID